MRLGAPGRSGSPPRSAAKSEASLGRNGDTQWIVGRRRHRLGRRRRYADERPQRKVLFHEQAPRARAAFGE
jgi:hypothetical protein